ncbi:MAG: DUF1587 domain-containing protein, partial [Planctomycetota bacterium]
MSLGDPASDAGWGPLPVSCAVLIYLAAVSCCAAADAGSPPAADRYDATVGRFLGQYCLACHSTDAAEGDRDFESLRFPLLSAQQLITANEIIDQITLKEMPPEGSEQPTDEERLAVVGALREGVALARGRLASSGGRTVMRRLSRREYENTLAVLFNRRVDTLGLTADFPKDNAEHHLDNLGAALVTSGFLLDQYFQAANRLVEMRLGKGETEPQTWRFTENFKQYEELSGS